MAKIKKKSRASMERRRKMLGSKVGEESTIDVSSMRKAAPLIAKLSSSVPNDRAMAISAISMICDTDAKMRKVFLKEKLVPITMEQLLNDNSDEVAMEAWGLLRNLVVDEGYDVAVYTWRNDIWTAVSAGLAKASDSLDRIEDSTGTVEKTLLFDYIENVVGFVEALSETEEDLLRRQVMEKVLSEQVIGFLSKIRTHQRVTDKLHTFVIGFFYEVSANSLEFLQTVARSISREEVRRASGLLGQLYQIGLDFQLREVENKISADQVLQYLENIHGILIQVDLSATTKEATSDVPTKEEITGFQRLKENIQAVDVALDLISALVECVGSNELATDQILALSLEQIVPLVMQCSANDEFVSKALVALYNFSWLLKNEHSWVSVAQTLLEACVPKAFETTDLELKTDYLNLAWVLCDTAPYELSDAAPVQQLISFSVELVKSETPQLASYYTALVRFLGKLAMSSLATTGAIGDFLMECLESSVDRLVSGNVSQVHSKFGNLFEVNVVECCNVLFEVFGDKSYAYDAPVFRERGYNAKLQQLVPHVRRVFKLCDRSRNPELKDSLEEAMDNLPRFVEYKASE